jgi:NAD(P)-dependent dehydrogenase (short-subunit alcohol dehydrogenase family)
VHEEYDRILGAQGIGRATALAAAQDGLRVVILDIDMAGG